MTSATAVSQHAATLLKAPARKRFGVATTGFRGIVSHSVGRTAARSCGKLNERLMSLSLHLKVFVRSY
ncbi:hypothetical protein HYPDE_34203 [Hyphomicrobium denitrificans 1NES1]|uniref:Uncharacterized protein n=1 Tax=Hyphomicrobium denitrificans 1NES1 TaxID=670307 RepID=N0B8G7_9HYPH|nr:hypothetical protein HYPDE_34203 [Hyphomicrobium denitrificans 1NES1]